jgi:hypothetical protein
MARRGRSGHSAKRQRWQELVRRWQCSGQTVREFCCSAEVKESAFYWWRRRLARGGVRRGEERHVRASVPRGEAAEVRTSPTGSVRVGAARFLPVQVVVDQARESRSGVEIHWDDGRNVRLQRGFDRQTLADVLAVLEARPC